MNSEQIRIQELENDISRLKKEIADLNKQLEEANAANASKETFLSNMSHDIRTPMNAIVGMTALAKKHIDEKSRVSDALNKIETASGHLLELINEVLEMSRINTGRLELADSIFSLSDILHEIMTIIRPQMEQKGHHFIITTENITAERFHGDPLRIRQILVNILNNSVKYTEPGGEVEFRVSETMDEDVCLLRFECRDNGIGMSEEFLKRIFDPFERADSQTVSRIEGTGLGMSIVKKMVEAMKGTINIDSKTGEGTTVTIVLPLIHEDEPADAGAIAGKRLLILEADETVQEAYRQYLGGTGLDTEIVASVTDALSALADADMNNCEFNAVIIGNRHKDGGNFLEIAGYLSRSFPDLKILLAGDYNWDEIEYQAESSGITGFIPLPFFRKTLINSLNDHLEGDYADTSDKGMPDLNGRNILLVEDNMINLEIAREIIGTTNAHIDTAENGQEAVERFLASDPGFYDIILMDVQMPVMDGYSATRKIRESKRADAALVPIYAMTANTFAEDIAKAGEAGMNGHLAKPIDINILMQTLRRVSRADR